MAVGRGNGAVCHPEADNPCFLLLRGEWTIYRQYRVPVSRTGDQAAVGHLLSAADSPVVGDDDCPVQFRVSVKAKTYRGVGKPGASQGQEADAVAKPGGRNDFYCGICFFLIADDLFAGITLAVLVVVLKNQVAVLPGSVVVVALVAVARRAEGDAPLPGDSSGAGQVQLGQKQVDAGGHGVFCPDAAEGGYGQRGENADNGEGDDKLHQGEAFRTRRVAIHAVFHNQVHLVESQILMAAEATWQGMGGPIR